MSFQVSEKSITMAEYAEKGHRFNCWCQECGHSNSPSAEEMIGKGVPTDLPAKKLEEVLKCSSCGSEDVCSLPLNSHLTVEQMRASYGHR